ncbi:MAG: glycosyltransferase family 2 protein [Elusimicrobia bacterium]|jgi:dolichol-phosphate mannosyltransferase|nr:glycosyltransferase family 2 protein [Elusimicrobiota bacterium]
MEEKTKNLSVIIPVYNEEANLRELITRTSAVLEKLGGKNEIICIDDLSTDGSLAELLKLKDEYRTLRVIAFHEHLGQSGALAAGFRNARENIVATLDADMQCVPEDIPLLIESLGENDAVCPKRSGRKDSRIKKISSRIGNGARNFITGEDIEDTNCPLKLFRREVIQDIPYFKGFHRFIPTLLKLYEYSVAQIPVSHYPRRYGKSKYNVFNRLFKGMADVLGVYWLKKNRLSVKCFSEEK